MEVGYWDRIMVQARNIDAWGDDDDDGVKNS